MKATRYMTIEQRLVLHLSEMPNGCLEWTLSTRGNGYGQIGVDGKQVATHRVAWELVNGPIPKGLHVLHKCDNPPCCNVDHLFLGSPADNTADKIAKGRHGHLKKTHCPQGHPYDEANTYVSPKGVRMCRICSRAADARFRAKKK